MRVYPLTTKSFLPGTRVRHLEYGWLGTVSRFAHADGRLMIIWDDTGGASLWDPMVLTDV